MRKNLEIPQGKRTGLYRFFEILPGVLSYSAIILLFVLSWINPILGSIYLFVIVTITLVKAVGVAYRTIQGYSVIERAKKVDWRSRVEDLSDASESYERLKVNGGKGYNFEEHLNNLKVINAASKGEYPDPEKIYHLIIMTAYNEGAEVLRPSIEAILKSTFPKERIIFALAYEERGGEEMEKVAIKLKREFNKEFKFFEIIKHPSNLKGEVIGKGPNLTYAGEYMAEFLETKKVPIENVIVTSLDCDNHLDLKYLDAVAYEFIVRPNRQHFSYQPVSIYTNNIWDAPAPSRVIAVSNSFFNVITTMRPHTVRNFASHSQPLWALKQMNFWSKRTIDEDGHQYWRSLFYFDGKYSVVPIRIPIYQDAVLDDNLWKTIKAQFIQVRRWYYGASDVAYVGVRLFGGREERRMPFWPLFAKFWRLLDGHLTLAVMAPLVAFGGWVPMIINSSMRSMVAYNLPQIVGIIQTVASIGLFVTVLISLRILPPRPKKYHKEKTIFMVLQWILMPVTSIFYQSLAAFYAQTRLMFGKYMEKFDVTKKVVK